MKKQGLSDSVAIPPKTPTKMILRFKSGRFVGRFGGAWSAFVKGQWRPFPCDLAANTCEKGVIIPEVGKGSIITEPGGILGPVGVKHVGH